MNKEGCYFEDLYMNEQLWLDKIEIYSGDIIYFFNRNNLYYIYWSLK